VTGSARIIVGIFLIGVVWVAGCFALFFILFAAGVIGACHSGPGAEWIVPAVFYSWGAIGLVAAIAYGIRCVKQDAQSSAPKPRDMVAEMRRELRADKSKTEPPLQ